MLSLQFYTLYVRCVRYKSVERKKDQNIDATEQKKRDK